MVTDRHIQVSSYMANEKPEIEHAYDVWHVAKGNCSLSSVDISCLLLTTCIFYTIRNCKLVVLQYFTFYFEGEKKIDENCKEEEV